MLGVGGIAVELITFLAASRHGDLGSKEVFLRIAKRVIRIGLFFIILSGAVITAVHLALGQSSIVFEPAFLCKWLLILLVTFFEFFNIVRVRFNGSIAGLSGGLWFSLFTLHVLAPASNWLLLLSLWGVAMLSFLAVWSIVLSIIRLASPHPNSNMVSEPKVLIETPKATQPFEAIQPIPTPQPITPQQALIKPPSWLMPKVHATEVASTPPLPQQPTVQETQNSLDQKMLETIQKNLQVDEYPFKSTTVGESPMLHPHLTESYSASGTHLLPTQATPVQSKTEIQLPTEAILQTLPTIRIMPKTPKDLETQHSNPMVSFR